MATAEEEPQKPTLVVHPIAGGDALPRPGTTPVSCLSTVDPVPLPLHSMEVKPSKEEHENEDENDENGSTTTPSQPPFPIPSHGSSQRVPPSSLLSRSPRGMRQGAGGGGGGEKSGSARGGEAGAAAEGEAARQDRISAPPPPPPLSPSWRSASPVARGRRTRAYTTTTITAAAAAPPRSSSPRVGSPSPVPLIRGGGGGGNGTTIRPGLLPTATSTPLPFLPGGVDGLRFQPPSPPPLMHLISPASSARSSFGSLPTSSAFSLRVGMVSSTSPVAGGSPSARGRHHLSASGAGGGSRSSSRGPGVGGEGSLSLHLVASSPMKGMLGGVVASNTGVTGMVGSGGIYRTGPTMYAPVVDITDKQGLKFRLSSKVLGRGASGEVRLGLSHMGAIVAVKIVEVLVASSTDVPGSPSGPPLSPSSTTTGGGGNTGSTPPATPLVAATPMSERAKALQRRRLQRKGIASEANVQQAMDALLGEIHMLSRLRHSCIVGYIGAVVEEGRRFMLIMEYTSGGSLKKVLDLFADSLTPDQAIGYLKDVLHGLVYLHSQRIVHRDVKPENVLLSVSGGCKLIDFGISKQVSAATRGGVGEGSMHVDGTPFYMAPEAFREGGKGVTAKADIWSFGIMLAQVWTRHLPWPENISPMTIAFHLSRNTEGFRPEPRYHSSPPASPFLGRGTTSITTPAMMGSQSASAFSNPSNSPTPTAGGGGSTSTCPGSKAGWIMGEEVMEVFRACTQRDPDQRPTATALLQMPLFKQPVPLSSRVVWSAAAGGGGTMGGGGVGVPSPSGTPLRPPMMMMMTGTPAGLRRMDSIPTAVPSPSSVSGLEAEPSIPSASVSHLSFYPPPTPRVTSRG